LPGRVGLACGLAVFVTILVGSLWHNRPNAVSIDATYLSPSWAHPFGTDEFGRDELARVAAGGRTSLSAAALVILLAMGVALVIGTVSGLLGGVLDSVVMRLNDVILSIPSLVLAMGLISALGISFWNLVIALSVSYAAEFTRMVRTFTLSSRRRGDVIAAHLAGVGWWRTLFTHVLPGVASQLVVISTLCFGNAIIGIASLSFLGLGVRPPASEWGSMLAGAQSTLTFAPWLILAPGLAIVLSALAVNLIADSLREAAA
jgi:ABC-type dipeptide/oligopeptide/nickel transport system permease subunit